MSPRRSGVGVSERRQDWPMLPGRLKLYSRFFRERRNRRLAALIEELWGQKGAALDVLDVGGATYFWTTLPEASRNKCNISLINLPGAYDGDSAEEQRIRGEFQLLTGDARDLSQFQDRAFDLVVSNSVIEHLGVWPDMERAAREAFRVGKRGWVQVPAFEFPIEQHFLLPLVHWFAAPIQIAMLSFLRTGFGALGASEQHLAVHRVRPLSRSELTVLFPNCAIASQWIFLPKCHIATW